MAKLTHIGDDGEARMVDVSDKDITDRTATAHGTVLMAPETLKLVIDGTVKKGDVISVARLAGIMAAAIIPASLATEMTSPFLTVPSITSFSVSGAISTVPCAVAVRSVMSLSDTSTMRASPSSPMWVNFAIIPPPELGSGYVVIRGLPPPHHSGASEIHR